MPLAVPGSDASGIEPRSHTCAGAGDVGRRAGDWRKLRGCAPL